MRPVDALSLGKELIDSPFDVAARFSYKRSTRWVGYKVQLRECSAPDLPHLITHVETTPATSGDVEVTGAIHAALSTKQLLPQRHLVDRGYLDAELLEQAQRVHRMELYGPVRRDISWQARAENGYALADFDLDWANEQARCPQGQFSSLWSPGQDDRGQAVITIHFDAQSCGTCAV